MAKKPTHRAIEQRFSALVVLAVSLTLIFVLAFAFN